MTDKLVNQLVELTSIDGANDKLVIQDASDDSELKFVVPNNVTPDASDTVKGKVELATTAETTTGTDATRAVTPKGLHDMTSLSGAAWFKDEDNMASDSATTVPSQQSVKAYGDRALNTTLNIHPLYAPPGFVINGKILVTDTGSGINVALKTFANADPSATDPVYIPIGNSVRILSAHGTNYLKDVTIPDGVNTFNSGSAELATKEIDYFVYACYNSSYSLTQLLISRFPGARVYGDFSTTATNEKYAAYYSGIQPFTSDTVEVIGRFAATLSAGAGYTWSVPTYTAKNLIQRPIYETRWLTYVATRSVSGGTAPTYTSLDQNKYRISGNRLEYMIAWDNTAGGTAGVGANPLSTKLPFSFAGYTVQYRHMVGNGNVNESAGTVGSTTHYTDSESSFTQFLYTNVAVAGQDQSSTVRFVWGQGFYEI